MQGDSPTPAELVERIRAGDRCLEDELVRRYSRGVMFVIGQSVSDPSAAEDLYQDSFRLILEKVRAGEVREPARLSGFISGIARNLVIEHFRKTSRREARQPAEEARPIASAEPSALDRLLREEKASLARQVLAALPSERDRQALYRFYIADQEREDICTALGITNALLSQILCRARARYRDLFERRSARQKE